MNKEMQKRIQFDWQIPGFLDRIWLDIPSYLEAIDRIRPDAIMFMAKSAFGCTYYDDAYGTKNEALEQDLFADLVGPLHDRGIQVIAYVNVTLNDIVAKEHPEWHQITPEGQPVVAFTYQQLCMNSPYRNLLFDMMADLAGKYPIDGIWFDITYVYARGCFCRYCKALFEKETGLALTPEIASDPRANALFHAFRRDTRRRFSQDAMSRINQVRPGLLWGWNHAGDPTFSQPETDSLASYSSMEFHPPAFARGGRNARVMRAQGKPYELIMPESLASWGDWTVAVPNTLKTMVAIVGAHGGSPTINHVAWPSGDLGGKLAPAVVDTLSEAFRFYESRLPYCEGTESEPVGAVLHSIENWHARVAHDGLTATPRNATWLDGAADLLADNCIHFDILDERRLEQLPEYEFLLLGEIGYLSEATSRAIRTYVKNGGCLLATGMTSLTDAYGDVGVLMLADLLGVDFEEESEYSTAYMGLDDRRLAEGVADMPILVRSAAYSDAATAAPARRSLRCRPRPGTQVLATIIDPVLEPDVPSGYHIYHAHPPAANLTRWPAAVYTRYGEGQVVYFPVPLTSAYATSHSPWLRRIAANALNIMGVPRKLRVNGPAGIETVLNRQKDRWLLHLIPRRTEMPESAQVATDSVIQNVTVRVQRPGTTSVTLQPGDTALDLETEGDVATFRVPPFGEWTILVID